MASVIDICNTALAHLGDDASVASIDPPEGSPQASHCARFYPIARDSLLEMFDWSFATKRATLAQTDFPFAQWAYSYAHPADALRILAVLAPDATDDYSAPYPQIDVYSHNALANQFALASPQPFATEMDDQGRPIILTNQADAVVRYTGRILDSGRFSPLFTDVLGRYLASFLAGPILKGDSGINQGKAQLGIAMALLARATVSSANQQSQNVVHVAPWLGAR